MIIDEIKELMATELINNRMSLDVIKYDNNLDGSISVSFDKKLMIKVYEKNKYLQVPIQFLETVELSENIEIKNLKSLIGYSRIIINTLFLSDEVIHLLKLLLCWFIDNYTSSPFSCCSRYVECSNAKHCIHPDSLYSKGCSYRNNLEKGRIFYGVNKTI